MAQLSARQVHEADTRLIADAAKIRFFPLVVDRGEGCRIIDPDGRRYLDFTAAWALATIEAIEQDGLAEHARRVGEHLSRRLHGLAESCPLIGDVRGLGLFQGVELVRDHATKEPATLEAAKVCYRAFELGLLVFYVGMASNVLEITPPLVIGEAKIDEGVEVLGQAHADVAAGRVSDEEVARIAGW